MRNCVTCGGPDRLSLGHGYDDCIRYLNEQSRQLWEESAKKHAEMKQLRELREAKAAPQCTCELHKGLHPAPAPPFVLGPKSFAALMDCMSSHAIDSNNAKRVARETARLIAEWLRKSTDWLDHDRANKIARGDWGIE